MPLLAPSTVDTLDELANALLTVVADALASTNEGVPLDETGAERVYAAPSPPPFDCCAFASVHVAGLGYAPVGPQGGVSRGITPFGLIQATLIVTAVRCAAQGDPIPEPAAIAAVAKQVRQDGWAIWNHIRHARSTGAFQSWCDAVTFQRGTPIPEQGGCVGWTFALTAALNGYTPEEGDGS